MTRGSQCSQCTQDRRNQLGPGLGGKGSERRACVWVATLMQTFHQSQLNSRFHFGEERSQNAGRVCPRQLVHALQGRGAVWTSRSLNGLDGKLQPIVARRE